MEFKFNGKTFNGKDYQKFMNYTLETFKDKIDQILQKIKLENKQDLEIQLSKKDRTILSDIRNKNLIYYKDKFDILNKSLEDNDLDLLSKEFIRLYSTFDDIIRKIAIKINNPVKASNLDILVFDNSLKHMKIHIEKMKRTNNNLVYEKIEDDLNKN